MSWLENYRRMRAESDAMFAGVAPPPASKIPVVCVHLGTDVGYRQCPTCRGNVRLKTYPCALGYGDGGRVVPSQDCGPKCPGYTTGA